MYIHFFKQTLHNISKSIFFKLFIFNVYFVTHSPFNFLFNYFFSHNYFFSLFFTKLNYFHYYLSR